MTGSASASWPAEASSVPQARRLVRNHLAGLPETAALRDDAELLVSELVANVVLHVGGTVTVTVSATAGEVLLEVADDSPVAPTARLFSSTASTGRGMRLLTSLSSAHGVRTRPAGKTVWVRLTAATAGRSDDELVASFAEVDWLAELATDDAGASAEVRARGWAA